jgi:hypothetical protein
MTINDPPLQTPHPLLILLAVLPPLLWIGWSKYEAWKAEQERQRQRVAFGYG